MKEKNNIDIIVDKDKDEIVIEGDEIKITTENGIRLELPRENTEIAGEAEEKKSNKDDGLLSTIKHKLQDINIFK